MDTSTKLAALLGLACILAAAAPDPGLSALEQRALVARVERLEREVAALKANPHTGSAGARTPGGLRVEDHQGGAAPAGDMGLGAEQLTPAQRAELQRQVEAARRAADQRAKALEVLQGDP